MPVAEPTDHFQTTLDGQEIQFEHKTCGVYTGCESPAAYDFGDVLACSRCAAEITEPDDPDDAERARRLSATEQIVTEVV